MVSTIFLSVAGTKTPFVFKLCFSASPIVWAPEDVMPVFLRCSCAFFCDFFFFKLECYVNFYYWAFTGLQCMYTGLNSVSSFMVLFFSLWLVFFFFFFYPWCSELRFLSCQELLISHYWCCTLTLKSLVLMFYGSHWQVWTRSHFGDWNKHFMWNFVRQNFVCVRADQSMCVCVCVYRYIYKTTEKVSRASRFEAPTRLVESCLRWVEANPSLWKCMSIVTVTSVSKRVNVVILQEWLRCFNDVHVNSIPNIGVYVETGQSQQKHKQLVGAFHKL